MSPFADYGLSCSTPGVTSLGTSVTKTLNRMRRDRTTESNQLA
jgi:hypothetical protein